MFLNCTTQSGRCVDRCGGRHPLAQACVHYIHVNNLEPFYPGYFPVVHSLASVTREAPWYATGHLLSCALCAAIANVPLDGIRCQAMMNPSTRKEMFIGFRSSGGATALCTPSVGSANN